MTKVKGEAGRREARTSRSRSERLQQSAAIRVVSVSGAMSHQSLEGTQGENEYDNAWCKVDLKYCRRGAIVELANKGFADPCVVKANSLFAMVLC
jgi:hypothetical protein